MMHQNVHSLRYRLFITSRVMSFGSPVQHDFHHSFSGAGPSFASIHQHGESLSLVLDIYELAQRIVVGLDVRTVLTLRSLHGIQAVGIRVECITVLDIGMISHD
jgi:hypothetical protein